jgi:hypothetical protein
VQVRLALGALATGRFVRTGSGRDRVKVLANLILVVN